MNWNVPLEKRQHLVRAQHFVSNVNWWHTWWKGWEREREREIYSQAHTYSTIISCTTHSVERLRIYWYKRKLNGKRKIDSCICSIPRLISISQPMVFYIHTANKSKYDDFLLSAIDFSRLIGSGCTAKSMGLIHDQHLRMLRIRHWNLWIDQNRLNQSYAEKTEILLFCKAWTVIFWGLSKAKHVFWCQRTKNNLKVQQNLRDENESKTQCREKITNILRHHPKFDVNISVAQMWIFRE